MYLLTKLKTKLVKREIRGRLSYTNEFLVINPARGHYHRVKKTGLYYSVSLHKHVLRYEKQALH